MHGYSSKSHRLSLNSRTSPFQPAKQSLVPGEGAVHSSPMGSSPTTVPPNPAQSSPTNAQPSMPSSLPVRYTSLPTPKQHTLHSFFSTTTLEPISLLDEPETWGHMMDPIDTSKTFWVLLQNPNGINPNHINLEFQFSLTKYYSLGVGVISIAESKLNWTKQQPITCCAGSIKPGISLHLILSSRRKFLYYLSTRRHSYCCGRPMDIKSPYERPRPLWSWSVVLSYAPWQK
jgi:hypothetical protein